MTTIVACADLHGHLPTNLPDGDILVIAGDICPVENHDTDYQLHWFDKIFRLWLLKQKDKYLGGIHIVAGNHDFVLEYYIHDVINLNLPWNYYEDTGFTYNNLNFWFSPHQPIFHNWAFNLSEKELAKKFALIPDNTNILVTHGPPRGILDWAPHEKIIGRRENAGSTSLRDRVLQLPNLKHHIFGHLHSNYGQRRVGDTLFSCVSIMNEGYRPVNPPTVITID